MSRRTQGKSRASDSLYADAYSWQQGEYYPEHHEANVRRLHQKYPDESLSDIDAIYRQACLIDPEVQERVGGTFLTPKAKEELLDWLEDHFYGFSRQSLLHAIEKAEPNEPLA